MSNKVVYKSLDKSGKVCGEATTLKLKCWKYSRPIGQKAVFYRWGIAVENSTGN